jgi:predicted transcriptional regulator
MKPSRQHAKWQESFVTEETESDQTALVELTADVIAAYVSHNSVPVKELAALIENIHATLKGAGAGAATREAPKELVPAVPIKKSITPDYLISLEDGKKFKSLKRHLSARYGLTPDEYRAKWGLPADYPMVAPNYTATRSALAKTIGLGRKAQPPPPPPPKRPLKKQPVATPEPPPSGDQEP